MLFCLSFLISVGFFVNLTVSDPHLEQIEAQVEAPANLRQCDSVITLIFNMLNLIQCIASLV